MTSILTSQSDGGWSLSSRMRKSRKERWLTATIHVMERTLRILAGDSTISLRSAAGAVIAPSWINLVNNQVSISESYLDKADDDPVMKLALIKGLLYHEVSHYLYTPRINLDRQGLQNLHHRTGLEADRYLRLMNELEDKRIETLFVRRFAPAAPYFERPLMEFIVKRFFEGMDTGCGCYLAVVGRPWIDPRIVTMLEQDARNRMGDAFVDEAQSVTREYLLLRASDYHTNHAKFDNLIVRWSKLQRGSVTHGNSCAGHASDSAQSKALEGLQPSPEAKKITADDDCLTEEDIEEMEERAAVKAAGEAGPDESEGDGGSDGTDEDDDAEEDGAATGSGDSEDDDGDDADDSQDTSEESSELESLVRNHAEALDEEIAGDVEGDLKAISRRSLSAAVGAMKDIFPYDDRAVTPSMISSARRIQTNLMRIRNEAAPQWNRRQLRGRLDGKRSLVYGDTNIDVFRRFNPGTEHEMKVHVMIGIDLSGSMNGGKADLASQVLWTLTEAFRRVDHKVEGFMFSTGYSVNEIHKRGEYRSYRGTLSTAPLDMMRAMNVSAQQHTDCSEHLLVVVTDGGFDAVVPSGRQIKDPEEHFNAYADEMADYHRRTDGDSMLLQIGQNAQQVLDQFGSAGYFRNPNEPYGFQHVNVVNSPTDCVPALASYVQQLMLRHR